MALDVPGPVAAYLAAEVAKDADAISCCFTEDGSVYDEGVIIAAVIHPPMETRDGHEIPIPVAADQRSNAWRQGDPCVPDSPVNFLESH